VIVGTRNGWMSAPPSIHYRPRRCRKAQKSNKSLSKHVKMAMRLFRSDENFSQMLDQFESLPEFWGPSRCRDDEPVDDEEDVDT
nr:hypothetical protein [Tanacetum cinerariifolium]